KRPRNQTMEPCRFPTKKGLDSRARSSASRTGIAQRCPAGLRGEGGPLRQLHVRRPPHRCSRTASLALTHDLAATCHPSRLTAPGDRPSSNKARECPTLPKV